MLDTVLQIGRAFRESSMRLKHNHFIISCPQDTDKESIMRISLPIRENKAGGFIFDFSGIKELKDENIIRDKLYYLNFKTSKNDSTIRYVFGDIYYKRNKKNKEYGNYRTIKYYKKNVFLSAEKNLKSLKNKRIIEFRKSFEKYKNKIEELLMNNNNIFIHFCFQFGNEFWYAKEELDEINNIQISYFTNEYKNDKIKGYVFETILYKTICSGNKKNDIQFPNFLNNQKYKSKIFSLEEINYLFYAIDYASKPALPSTIFKIGRANEKIKIIVLPKGNENKALKAEDYENFSITREEVVKKANEDRSFESLFVPVTEKINENIISFDVIFTKEGKNVESDVIEISGIEKSYIKKVKERIHSIKFQIEKEGKRKLNLIQSIYNILDDNSKSKKKYQNHLLKILPKIYTETYYYDSILLPALVEKMEFKIRNSESKNDADFWWYLLKYDFYYLTKIQNTKKEGENLMKIQESKSYKIGLLLGEIASQFASWRKDCPIKSFEKSYVGNLTRRIATIDDLIKLKNDIEQKLIMHERTKFTHSKSIELSEKIKSLEAASEKYDKNICAFGFFESYFYYSPTEEQDKKNN